MLSVPNGGKRSGKYSKAKSERNRYLQKYFSAPNALKMSYSLGQHMKPDALAKHLALAFLLALAVYVIFYEFIEHRRARNGPWQVTFRAGAAAAPAMVINQPQLAITNVQISFPGEASPASPAPVILAFNQPRSVPFGVPFGTCVFMDTTFLPGTVTFQLFGHEIELLPRALIIDQQEHPWRPDTIIALPHRPPAPVRPKS